MRKSPSKHHLIMWLLMFVTGAVVNYLAIRFLLWLFASA